MKGQWIGRFTGTNKGLAVVDLDDRIDHYSGTATLVDDNPATSPLYVPLRSIKRVTPQTLDLDVYPTGGDDVTQSATFQQPAVAPIKAHVVLSFEGDVLHFNATTNIGTAVSANLAKSQADTPSTLVPCLITDWAAFKEFVLPLEPRRSIFRGQQHTQRLRTRFHRSGRADIIRFQVEDVPALHRRLSSVLPHAINMGNAEEYGALLSLVQHHGYPTPLLDWSYSPFVAAFFAYRHVNERDLRDENAKVRIFAFEKAEWESNYPQLAMLRPYGLHLSTVELLALANDRMVPQQATSTVTNVDDIETYIAEKEAESGRTFLTAIDLPVRERPKVMTELSVMGVTAGSLFPGLDGACEELRERFFPVGHSPRA